MTLLCRLMKCPGWQRHMGVCRISRIGIHSRLWLNNNENQKTQVCLTVCHRSTFSRLVFVKLIIIINSCQIIFFLLFPFFESNIKHFGTEWIKLDNKVTPNTLLCKLTWTERSIDFFLITHYPSSVYLSVCQSAFTHLTLLSKTTWPNLTKLSTKHSY